MGTRARVRQSTCRQRAKRGGGGLRFGQIAYIRTLLSFFRLDQRSGNYALFLLAALSLDLLNV